MKVSKKNKRSDIKTKIIKKQINEIDGLKQQISELEIDCNEKDEIIWFDTNSPESILRCSNYMFTNKNRIEL